MRKPSGFTLIEIIVTLVVIGISATLLLSVFGSAIQGSGDPMVQQQATTIAEAYMEEIMLKAYSDPQGGETGSDEGEAANRSLYDDVQDYNSLATTQVRRQDNSAVTGLAQYSIAVLVSAVVLNSVPAMRIDISVSHAAIADISLSAFRTSYP